VLSFFLNFGPRDLEMLQVPRYVNPALHISSIYFNLLLKTGVFFNMGITRYQLMQQTGLLQVKVVSS